MNLIKGLQEIRTGIVEQSWEKVAHGYYLLTDEELEVTGGDVSLQRVKEEMVRIIGLIEGGFKPEVPPKKTTAKKKPLKNSQPQKREDNNLFDPSEFPEDPLDKLIKRQPKPPPRPKFKTVKVTCGRCQKTYDVNPLLIPPRLGADDEAPTYMCDKCKPMGG